MELQPKHETMEDVDPPAAAHALHPPAAQPVSDLEVAAQYAEFEVHSVAEQFAGASVAGVPQPVAVASSSSTAALGHATAQDDDDDETEDDNDDDSDDEAASASSSSDANDHDSDSDSDDDGDDEASRNKLRAEIEAAMEREENKATGPLKTANEVAVIPVREPRVELTADCSIARCGTILNVSVPGLMLTIKSDMNAKPLDEESVLCLEDRTVLGCVDEVFGPVMMPMYLVRFECAEKMPAQATVNTVVYYATEHTTYIVPEQIKDKGTDASNIFDEETDETVYSDDEAESAAKRLNRKRNRGGNASQYSDDSAVAPGGGARGGSDRSSSSFSDYRHGASSSSRGGRASNGAGARSNSNSGSYAQNPPAQPAIQSQSHGGHTHYTQPGFAAPGPHMAYAVQPMGYAQPPVGYAQQQPPPPPMPFSQVPMHQPPQHPYQQPPPPHFHPQQHQFQHAPRMPAYAPPMPGQQQFYHAPPPPPLPHQPYHGAVPSQYAPQGTTYYTHAPPQQAPRPPLPPGPYDHPQPPRT